MLLSQTSDDSQMPCCEPGSLPFWFSVHRETFAMRKRGLSIYKYSPRGKRVMFLLHDSRQHYTSVEAFLYGYHCGRQQKCMVLLEHVDLFLGGTYIRQVLRDCKNFAYAK